MCVGSVVIVKCSGCGSTEEIPAYLGCAMAEHARFGWTTRESSIISWSTHTISHCDECSDFATDSNTDFDSDKASLCSFQSGSEYECEVLDPSTAIVTLRYSLGCASPLAEAWYHRAISSIGPFVETMDTLITRAIALQTSQKATALQRIIELITLECDSWQGWLASEKTRAVETEKKLSDVLNLTGVTAEVNATNVEDMTAEMMDLYSNLTTFHIHYDVEYNVARFEGYLSVLAARLERLEAAEFGTDAAVAEAFLALC